MDSLRRPQLLFGIAFVAFGGMGTEGLTMVGRKHHQGVVGKSFLFQLLHQSAEMMVHLAAHSVVAQCHAAVLCGIGQLPSRYNLVIVFQGQHRIHNPTPMWARNLSETVRRHRDPAVARRKNGVAEGT